MVLAALWCQIILNVNTARICVGSKDVIYDKLLAGEDCLNKPICYKRRVIIVGSRTATNVYRLSHFGGHRAIYIRDIY